MKQTIFIPVDVMVAHLNELLVRDRESVMQLVNYRVHTGNKEFAESDFPIVMAQINENEYRYGIVGVLNGMVVGGRIAAVYHDDALTRLSHFEAVYAEFPNVIKGE
ncbi:hypothetical protein DEEACLCL_00067 [Salmonella phage CRW-SP2]|nr:hypothetical protein DEEACLCL_00067 [Salmonella phage CRW-SP2]